MQRIVALSIALILLPVYRSVPASFAQSGQRCFPDHCR
jgi:hypothetical protein